MNDKETIQKILTFWFEETNMKQKYAKDPEFDQKIRDEYLRVYEAVMAGKTESWRKTAEGRLAEIIVLDQFTRNMFRDDARAFEGDELALKLAVEAREVGADKQVSEEWRSSFYMPYMHSESKEVHKEALSIFEEYGNKVNLKYEKIHKDIVDRFGRYPHRNKVLGRESTLEELEFLKKHTGF